MGLLLHLSDLHLAAADATSDVTGDYKIDALPVVDRQRRTESIRTTLKQLGRALTEDGTALDGIVISGDVTVRGRADGIDLLPRVLAQLGSGVARTGSSADRPWQPRCHLGNRAE